MAVDSIIASPTNKVRVIVAEASGCWAREESAVATAFPSAKAGPIAPKLVLIPAVQIDATAMIVKLSIVSPFLYFLIFVFHDIVPLTLEFAIGSDLRALVAAAIYTAARTLKIYA